MSETGFYKGQEPTAPVDTESLRVLLSKSREGDLFKRLVSWPRGWIRKTKHEHYIYLFLI